MKPILCAGLVCLDQVTEVASFPVEDTDMRTINQYKVTIHYCTLDQWDDIHGIYWNIYFQVRGGNANNSATVLAHLGFQAEFLGTIAEGRVRLQMKV